MASSGNPLGGGGVVGQGARKVLGSASPGSRLGDRNFNLDKERQGTVEEVVDQQAQTNEHLEELLDLLRDSDGSGSGPFDRLLDSISSATERGGGDGDGDGGLLSSIAGEGGGNFSDMFGRIRNIEEGIDSSGSNLGGIQRLLGGNGGSIMNGVNSITAIMKVMRAGLELIIGTVEGGIRESIQNQANYLGPISARLQSFSNASDVAYKTLSKEIRNVFTNSRYIDQQKMLENLNKLVEQGIGYNLEDRAYLATIADRTTSTFDLLEPSLTRIIRLQQADLTRMQMGAEAYLTQFLNEHFEDTSYLTDAYDSVLAQLLEASSQMSYEETTGFLFNAQKWLASLYSVGMSQQAVSTIAEGLGYLGSGNVSALTGNNQLNTLFAMSAQQAGLDYANLLTYGLSDKNVDVLLGAMVKYLQAIANNTDSEVLRSEYGRVFGGLTVSDLRALQNLTTEDITAINQSTLSWEQAKEEMGNQIAKVEDRTSAAQQVENMINNFIYSLGASLAEDKSAYYTWLKADITKSISDALGDSFDSQILSAVTEGIGLVMGGLQVGTLMDAAYNDLSIFHNAVQDDLERQWDETVDKFKRGEGTLADGYTLANLSTYGGVNNPNIYLSGRDPISSAISNWGMYSMRGISSEYEFETTAMGPKGERRNQFTSTLSKASDLFKEQEAKIKQSAKNVTGIDDTIAKSLDEIYAGLFDESSKPLRVTIVGADGNTVTSGVISGYNDGWSPEPSAVYGIQAGLNVSRNDGSAGV